MHRSRGTLVLLVFGVVLLVAGLIASDWLPFRVLPELEGSRYHERRILIRNGGVFLVILGAALVVFRGLIARRLPQLVLALVAILIPVVLFVGVDIWRGHREIYQEDRPRPERRRVPHELLGWTHVTDRVDRHRQSDNFDVVYELDSDGFKTVPNEGVARRSIYLFGDSFTFGHGVSNEDTYANVMAREYLAPDVHVFNPAVSGYGTQQMYARFLMLLDRVGEGDIVIFAPISDDMRRNWIDFVRMSRRVYHASPFMLKTFPIYQDGEIRAVSLDRSWWRIKSWFFVGEHTWRNFRFLYQAIAAPDTTRETGQIFASARERTEARGGQFAATFLPTAGELRKGRYREDVSELEFSSIWEDFPQGPAAKGIRFATNIHWNAEGQAIAARAITRLLVRLGYLEDQDLRPEAAVVLGVAGGE